MKSILFTALFIFSAVVQAGSININGIQYGEGLTLQTGSIFFNTGEPGVDDPVISQGVGQVLAIYQDGDIIWENGDNGKEYNFFFDNLILAAFDGPNIFGQVSYGDVFGEFGFYSNEIGTFKPTGDFLADAAAIMSGDLNIAGVGHDVFGFTVTGTTNQVSSNSGSGQVQIIEGDAIDAIVQDSIERIDGSFADMTFNYSADPYQTFGYDWSGSVDFAVQTQTVSEPNLLALMGLGLIGMVGLRRKKI